jgi:uncharacterized protein (TIGR00730 family)
MRRICVYCGANPGNDPAFRQAAEALAGDLARQGLGLVYGGASVGLMGALADTMLQAGGEVIGVIPRVLVDREVAHAGLSELRVVESMHQRKAAMAELADAFIALPGGFGTLEEIFEILTWSQLGLHQKPCGLLNVNDYYQELVAFLERAVNAGLLREENRHMLMVAETPDRLLTLFDDYRAPTVEKWLGPENT